jgi:hypothetical protein
MLIAIGHQESRFAARRQLGGPARGFWQFELGGVNGVLSHVATKGPIGDALKALQYPHTPTPLGCHLALEHNDVLAATFARLLLWSLPGALPVQSEPDRGWAQYVGAWRPGKPRPETWSESWAIGWSVS